MFRDFETWRIGYYMISYFVASIIGYLEQVFYHKKDKWNIKSGLLLALFFIIMISVVIVIGNSPQVNLMSGFILMVVWGTCGYGSIILYYMRNRRDK